MKPSVKADSFVRAGDVKMMQSIAGAAVVFLRAHYGKESAHTGVLMEV